MSTDCARNETKTNFGGKTYCVTESECRITELQGISTMVVPTLLPLLIIAYITWKEGVRAVSTSYTRNIRLLYIKDHVTREAYERLKAGDEDAEVLDKGFTKYNRFRIDGVEARLPDPLDQGASQAQEIRAADVQTAREHRKLCGLVTPRPFGYVRMVWKLIMHPLTVMVWGIVDVFFDTYYFYQLERGDKLLRRSITRIVHVNNAVLACAILGAIVSMAGGVYYIHILIHNIEEGPNQGKVVFLATAVVVVKIICEDAAELILEYFYVDRYTVDHQPWFIVGKDVITAMMYIMPLVKIITSGWRDYLTVDKSDRPVYVLLTAVRAAMSVAMVSRVIGMIIQYTDRKIADDCFKEENGKLWQTPFDEKCLNWCDWTVFVSISIVFFTTTLSIVTFCVKR